MRSQVSAEMVSRQSDKVLVFRQLFHLKNYSQVGVFLQMDPQNYRFQNVSILKNDPRVIPFGFWAPFQETSKLGFMIPGRDGNGKYTVFENGKGMSLDFVPFVFLLRPESA